MAHYGVVLSTKISVGVVHYRNQKGLIRLLKSLRLFYPKVQVYVVDGENDDDVREVCKKYSSTVLWVESEKNDIGLNRARLVEKCSTPLIAFIDSDCVPNKEWLYKLVKTYEQSYAQNPLVRGVGGGQSLEFSSEKLSFFVNCLHSPILLLGSPQSGQVESFTVDHLPTYNALFDKKTLLEVGNFPSTPWNVGEDLWLGWKLNKAGYRLVKRKEPLVSHYQGSDWFKRVFWYGAAQSIIFKKSKIMPQSRYWLSLFFNPAILTLLFFPKILLLFLGGAFVGGYLASSNKASRKSWAVVFPFFALTTYFAYSMGNWWGLVSSRRPLF